MYFLNIIRDDVTVDVLASTENEQRLKTTCFRRKANSVLWCAGNLFRWNNLGEVLRDEYILRALIKSSQETLAYGDKSDTVTVAYDKKVGWEGTAPLDEFEPEYLEPFELNRISRGLRLKPEFDEFLSPQTNQLTIVYRVTRKGKQRLRIEIYSVYPGVNIGDLKGDVTTRTGRVFFDWNQPGAENC